ncbi:MAG: sigma-70 family RNA polymerase sigma factor [Planctomycetia bacterium]|nr:sigma-70 family RNA polymerase sigma factor [Planctomycetia bacterium]
MNKSISTEKLARRQAISPEGLSQWTDEDLLDRYTCVGDPKAFGVLVHRYERELYSYLRRYLGDAAMAEDAFQGTFLQIHLKSSQFEPGRKFRPWLYTIATNQAIDAQRRNKRHRMVSLDRRQKGESEQDLGSLSELLVSREAGPAKEADAEERRRWIRDAVRALPDPLKGAVNLVYYQGLKYREAAEALKVPVGTVKSRLHTAITKLNEAWKTAEPSGDR